MNLTLFWKNKSKDTDLHTLPPQLAEFYALPARFSLFSHTSSRKYRPSVSQRVADSHEKISSLLLRGQ